MHRDSICSSFAYETGLCVPAHFPQATFSAALGDSTLTQVKSQLLNPHFTAIEIGPSSFTYP